MIITDALRGKTLVITGGTGSFGSTVLKHFLTQQTTSNHTKETWCSLFVAVHRACKDAEFEISTTPDVDEEEF